MIYIGYTFLNALYDKRKRVSLNSLFPIKPVRHGDQRGFFVVTYSKKAYLGLGIDWPVGTELIMSGKDDAAYLFADFEIPFNYGKNS
jgi:dTDP-4-dehydrorhamnose 3,5-epimerase-like enzyme